MKITIAVILVGIFMSANIVADEYTLKEKVEYNVSKAVDVMLEDNNKSFESDLVKKINEISIRKVENKDNI